MPPNVLASLAAAISAAVATLFVTPYLTRRAKAWGFVARPTDDRWHKSTTPLLGGVGIAAGVATGVCGAFLMKGAVAFTAIYIAAVPALMLIIGVIDDKLRLRPRTKLLLQCVGAVTSVLVLPDSLTQTPMG